MLDNYHRLELQMPLDEVEKLFGKPDFGTARPPGHLGLTATEPTGWTDSNIIVGVTSPLHQLPVENLSY